MPELRINSKSSKDTIKLGRQLAKVVSPEFIICLFGDLGTGKTTLVKGIAEGLKLSASKVNSPSFVLMNIYEGRMPLYHFDLYRLEGTKSILEIGYDEFLYGKGVAVIEWAERAGKMIPEEYLKITLAHKTENERVIIIKGIGEKYRGIPGRIKQL
ncbi:MAG: tRNA (adenosine(37)-N6)-threonylcarbamoyltransferase complex ATPase subunit type 1 TsaE [Candidatus Omnitrophica bacterium]|nr:tRNA (adenosine(37)-N6)-threonylcarbamoyltransferase complex ATPase subunit type 1 TsaE [Candidatus Omnitrophota bacterium]